MKNFKETIVCLAIIAMSLIVCISADASETEKRYEAEDYSSEFWDAGINGVMSTVAQVVQKSVSQTQIEIPVEAPHEGTYEITIRYGQKSFAAIITRLGGKQIDALTAWENGGVDYKYEYYTLKTSVHLVKGKNVFTFTTMADGGGLSEAIVLDYMDVIGYEYKNTSNIYWGMDFENVLTAEHENDLGVVINSDTSAVFSFNAEKASLSNINIVWCGSDNKKLTVYLNDSVIFEGSRNDLKWNKENPDTIMAVNIKEGTNTLKFTSEENSNITIDYIEIFPVNADISYIDGYVNVVTNTDASIFVAYYSDNQLDDVDFYVSKMNVVNKISFSSNQKLFIWLEKNLVPLCAPYVLE